MFKPAILYVDDEKTNLDTFKRAFGGDYLVKTCLSGLEALAILEKEDFPLIIADQRMPGLSGIELLEKLISLSPHTIRMILTAYSEPELLLDAINRGHVHDYIVKPWRKSELKPVIEKAFQDYKQKKERLEELELLARQSIHLKEEIREIYNPAGMIGLDGGLQDVFSLIQKVAPTDSTVLILGETGTGKELLARCLHELSDRRDKPFMAIHCGALNPAVLESELFGHEKGSFTGADNQRVGRFEAAQGGTLFLDEIGEISEAVQIKLLRVLQERQMERVGSNQSISMDVRVIAATHQNLEEQMRAGRFRSDLYYRLNVVPIKIPALRERKQDIEALAEFFVQKYSKKRTQPMILSASAQKALSQYDWPGNVRELQNIIERAVILASGPTIEPIDLNLNMEEMLKTEKVDLQTFPPQVSIRDQIHQEEINQLTTVLKKSHGNISEAARLMGIARSTLFHRLKKYGLV